MTRPFEHHPGFDTYPEVSRQPEQAIQPQSPEDLARISVTLALQNRGEKPVISKPELSPEAQTSARILILNNQQRTVRADELKAV